MEDYVYRPVDVIFDSALINDQVPNISGTSDNPTFNVAPGIKDVVGFSMLWANVPFTYYVIDETNNQLGLRDSLGTTYLLVLVNGTYNAINLISQLNEAVVLSGIPSPLNYKWYLDSTTSQLVLYNASNIFTLFVASNGPTQPLGFSVGQYGSTP